MRYCTLMFACLTVTLAGFIANHFDKLWYYKYQMFGAILTSYTNLILAMQIWVYVDQVGYQKKYN